MSDNATTSVSAVFETREAADRAIEHLVQHLDVNRADIFAEAEGDNNTSGTRPSGGDANKDDRASDPALAGAIRVSADVSARQVEAVQEVFRDLDGRAITRG